MEINFDDYNLNKDKNLLLENRDHKLKTKFRSLSRNLIYKDYLYPQISFWIPSSFKHSKKILIP